MIPVLLWRLRACTGWRRRTTRRRRGWRRWCTAGMCCSRRSRARWPTSPSRSWRRGAAPTASPCPTRSARGQRGPAREPRERLWIRWEWLGWPGTPAGLPALCSAPGAAAWALLSCEFCVRNASAGALLRIGVDWCFFDVKWAFCSQIWLQSNLLPITSICIT